MLDGYKTYLLSIATFAYGAKEYLQSEELGAVFVAVAALAMALRHAISKLK